MIEMAEPMFEILLFLAYLSVALISVVIAVFAISVSYFRRESINALWLLEKKEKELNLRLRSYKKLTSKQLRKEADAFEKEKNTIGGKLWYLSALGAVFAPCLAFTISLVISLYGLSNYPTNTGSYIFLSLSSIIIGSIFVFQTIRTIEWAASRVPLPKFNVFFKDYQAELKMKINEEREIEFGLSNYGEVIAEKVQLLIFFLPEFKISRGKGYSVHTQSSEYLEYPNYKTVTLSIDELHCGIASVAEIKVQAPSKPDKYPIPIRIYEKNVPETNLELTINVTE